AGLGFAVADDAADDEVGVVEGRAVCVDQRVAELATLVDRAGRLRGGVAGDATGEGELPEEAAHPLFVTPDVWVDLAVRALEPGVGDDARSTVSWAGDVDGVEVARSDDPVHV